MLMHMEDPVFMYPPKDILLSIAGLKTPGVYEATTEQALAALPRLTASIGNYSMSHGPPRWLWSALCGSSFLESRKTRQ